MQYTEGKEEINIIAVDPVSTDMVPGNTHKRRLLDVIDGSERVKFWTTASGFSRLEAWMIFFSLFYTVFVMFQNSM